MTSNIGSQAIMNMTEHGAIDIEIEAHVRQLLKKTLRPELLNRIDETTIFHQLTQDDLSGIVEIQITQLRKRLAERGLSLELTEDAKKALVEEGYDPQFGARPLKRVLQQRIENQIATKILGGEFKAGDAITADYQGKSFTLSATKQISDAQLRPSNAIEG